MTVDPISAGNVTPPLLSVVVPAYNEESRIGASLVTMRKYFDAQDYVVEVLVVDDGSADATVRVVEEAAAGWPALHLLRYDGNRGKGHAVRYGMLRATGRFVLFSDADLATPISEVEKLLQTIREGADVAIGSRDIPGSRLVRRQSIIRELGGKLFNRCVQILAVPGIRDTQCGFKLFTQVAASNIFSRCQVDNFSFDVETLYIGRLLGYRINEVPVQWAHQEGSKVRFFRDAIRMLRTLWRIRGTDYQVQADPRRSTVP